MEEMIYPTVDFFPSDEKVQNKIEFDIGLTVYPLRNFKEPRGDVNCQTNFTVPKCQFCQQYYAPVNGWSLKPVCAFCGKIIELTNAQQLFLFEKSSSYIDYPISYSDTKKSILITFFVVDISFSTIYNLIPLLKELFVSNRQAFRKNVVFGNFIFFDREIFILKLWPFEQMEISILNRIEMHFYDLSQIDFDKLFSNLLAFIEQRGLDKRRNLDTLQLVYQNILDFKSEDNYYRVMLLQGNISNEGLQSESENIKYPCFDTDADDNEQQQMYANQMISSDSELNKLLIQLSDVQLMIFCLSDLHHNLFDYFIPIKKCGGILNKYSIDNTNKFMEDLRLILNSSNNQIFNFICKIECADHSVDFDFYGPGVLDQEKLELCLPIVDQKQLGVVISITNYNLIILKRIQFTIICDFAYRQQSYKRIIYVDFKTSSSFLQVQQSINPYNHCLFYCKSAINSCLPLIQNGSFVQSLFICRKQLSSQIRDIILILISYAQTIPNQDIQIKTNLLCRYFYNIMYSSLFANFVSLDDRARIYSQISVGYQSQIEQLFAPCVYTINYSTLQMQLQLPDKILLKDNTIIIPSRHQNNLIVIRSYNQKDVNYSLINGQSQISQAKEVQVWELESIMKTQPKRSALSSFASIQESLSNETQADQLSVMQSLNQSILRQASFGDIDGSSSQSSSFAEIVVSEEQQIFRIALILSQKFPNIEYGRIKYLFFDKQRNEILQYLYDNSDCKGKTHFQKFKQEHQLVVD